MFILNIIIYGLICDRGYLRKQK